MHTVVDSIGGITFWPQLIEYLQEISGGEHCIVWELIDGRMQEIGAASRNGTDQAQRRLHQYADPRF